MRILIVHPHLSLYGGAETLLANFCSCLKKKGIDHRIMTLSISESVRPHFSYTEFILPKKSYDFKLSRSGAIGDIFAVLKETWALRRMMIRHAPAYDVVNVHNFPASWAAFRTPRPKVWMCNEPPEFWNNPRPHWILKVLLTMGNAWDRFIVGRSFSDYIVSDEFNSQRFRRKYGLIPKIVNYGIESEFFSRQGNASRVLEKYNLQNSFLMLQVGTISYTKNQLACLEALKDILPSIPNAKIIFAGAVVERYRRELEEFAKRHSLGDRIIFTGHISKAELRGLYHACHVALFPTKAQGGWLSPFEALSAGKPIVVSPLLSSSEIIRNEGIGVVTDNFGAALREIRADLKHYQIMARKGQQWVARNLSWELYTDKMISVLKTVVGRTSAD